MLVIGLLLVGFVVPVTLLRWWSAHQRTALFDEHRAAVTAKLEAVERLQARVAAIPPVTRDALTAGARPPVMAGYDHRAESNGAVVYQEDLGDVSRVDQAAPHYGRRIFQADLIVDCARLMRQGVYGTYEPQNVNVDVARGVLEACEQLAYVYILRTRHFEGLVFSGDVVAFEIDTGRHLGGFALAFTSDPRIDVVKDTSTRVDQTSRGGRLRNKRVVTTTEHLVRDDFGAVRGELDARIKEGLRQLMPGLRWLD